MAAELRGFGLRASGFGLIVAIAATVHAETRPKYVGLIEATLLGAPASLDPVTARSHAEITAVGLVFDTLYRLGPDGTPEPHLAVAPPVYDEKKLIARITIAKGVRFHDGTELTPQDVAASLERTRVMAKWVLAPVAEIHADADAVELTLRAPVADLPTLLALPQTAVTKAGKPPGEHPIGSGPFAVDAWDRAHSLRLKPFDDHFAGRPYVDLWLRWYDTPDAEASKFEGGAAQLSSRGTTVFAKSLPTYKAAPPVEAPVPLLVFVGFGRAHAAVTADKAFRHALDLAIARGGLATITSGESITPTTVPDPSATSTAGDPDAAAAVLKGAKAPELQPSRIGALRLDILVEDTRPDDREIADRVARALERLGIASTIVARPAQDVRERVARGAADLWIGQLVEPQKLPAAWWAAAFAAGGDDWPIASLAAGTFDAAAAQTAFADRLPILPLAFRGYKLWHRTDVRGLDFDGLGRPCFADLFYFGSPERAKK